MMRALLISLGLLTLLNFGCKPNGAPEADSPQDVKSDLADGKGGVPSGDAQGVATPVPVAPAVVPVPVPAPVPVPPPVPAPPLMGMPSGNEVSHGHHRKHPRSCEISNAPECGGKCPRGEECFDNEGICQCRPKQRLCGESAPTCDGTCPLGEECVAGLTGTCLCEPVTLCGDASGPECNGSCPPNLICILNDTSLCQCEGSCIRADAPECGGTCLLPNDICLPDGFGACQCQNSGGQNNATPEGAKK